MKLLTLNTHSLHGNNAHLSAASFCEFCAKEIPDIIALQEVNQSISTPLRRKIPQKMIPSETEIPIREDNYACLIADALEARGLSYFFIWLPVKLGYNRFDEGLAIFCRSPIDTFRVLPVSQILPYENWRRRLALAIRTHGRPDWFCNLHTGWWGDPEDPFEEEWQRLSASLPDNAPLWLMGDLNNPAEIRGEGYDRILCSEFFDTFSLARSRRGEETVRGAIDGWHGRITVRDRFRIDQIWCRPKQSILSHQTVFDGNREPIISDHFGVMIEDVERRNINY